MGSFSTRESLLLLETEYLLNVDRQINTQKFYDME